MAFFRANRFRTFSRKFINVSTYMKKTRILACMFLPPLHLTLCEAKEAVLIEGKLTIHCCTHKNAGTYGPSILVLEGRDIDLFKMYMNSVLTKLVLTS